MVDCTKDPNTEYNEFKSRCENTCQDRTALEDCTTRATSPGCQCKDGFVRDGVDGECVPEGDCDNQCTDVKKDPDSDSSDTLTIPVGVPSV